MGEKNRRVPGWYRDPNDPGFERWWDGMAWTTSTRERQVPVTEEGLGGALREAEHRAERRASGDADREQAVEAFKGATREFLDSMQALGRPGVAILELDRGPSARGWFIATRSPASPPFFVSEQGQWFHRSNVLSAFGVVEEEFLSPIVEVNGADLVQAMADLIVAHRPSGSFGGA